MSGNESNLLSLENPLLIVCQSKLLGVFPELIEFRRDFHGTDNGIYNSPFVVQPLIKEMPAMKQISS